MLFRSPSVPPFPLITPFNTKVTPLQRPVAAADPAVATSFDEIERRQRQEVNRLLFDGPATPFLGNGFGHINVDGTIELDSPERYVHFAVCLLFPLPPFKPLVDWHILI